MKTAIIVAELAVIGIGLAYCVAVYVAEWLRWRMNK